LLKEEAVERSCCRKAAEKSSFVKGTASAVPQVLPQQYGFSRWGTFFVSDMAFQQPTTYFPYLSFRSNLLLHLLLFL